MWLKKEQNKVEQVKVEHSYSRKRARKQASLKMKITIKFIKRRSIVLNVETHMKILSVMQIITGRVGIAVDAIRLIFAGQRLDEDETLEHYNIENKDTLVLVERMSGC